MSEVILIKYFQNYTFWYNFIDTDTETNNCPVSYRNTMINIWNMATIFKVSQLATMMRRTPVFSHQLSELRIYSDQTTADCWKTNHNCAGEFYLVCVEYEWLEWVKGIKLL